MIGFDPTTEISEGSYFVFPITIRANTTTEMVYPLEVTYVDGVGNAAVKEGNRHETGFDVNFGALETTERYDLSTKEPSITFFIQLIEDFIVEPTEFFRLNITLTSTENGVATCQAGDAEQYRCYHDIFILDDDCKSCHLSVWIILSPVPLFLFSTI